MSNINAQIGISQNADFEDKTWTFLMPETFNVSSGDFIIIPKNEYDESMHSNGWLPFEENIIEFNKRKKNDGDLLVRFDCGIICRYNEDHPNSCLTHFK